jgi:hypothetical protein
MTQTNETCMITDRILILNDPLQNLLFYPVDMDRKSKNHHRTKTQMLLNDKYVVVIADKVPNNIILCVNHIT